MTPAASVARDAMTTALQRNFPGDEILSDVSRRGDGRACRDRVWAINPLEPVHEGTDFIVAIALTVSATPVLGLICSPSKEMLYAAAWGAGAWVEEPGTTRPLRARHADRRRIRVIGSSHVYEPILASLRHDLAQQPMILCESPCLSCALIADGAADLYVHSRSGLPNWRCCAPDLILREAGGTVTNCYGEPLTYNLRSPVQRMGFIGSAPGYLETIIARGSICLAKNDPGSVVSRRLGPEEIAFSDAELRSLTSKKERSGLGEATPGTPPRRW